MAKRHKERANERYNDRNNEYWLKQKMFMYRARSSQMQEMQHKK